MSDPRRPDRSIVIIGSGLSGLCLGIRLRRAGMARYWWKTRRADLSACHRHPHQRTRCLQ